MYILSYLILAGNSTASPEELLDEVDSLACGLLTFLLRFCFGGGRRLRLPLGLLFGASRLGRLRLSLGLARRRLLGQACVEINQ